MYAQLLETGAKAVRSLQETSLREREFQQRIDAGFKIEPQA